MTDVDWSITGQYAENCSCEYLCPCIFSNSTALSKPAVPEVGDHCIAVICLHIETGRFGAVKLDDLSFIFIIKTALVMSQGGWTAAAVVDAKANPEQRRALEAIVTGQAGGPLSMMQPMIRNFTGVQYGPIEFHLEHNRRSVKVPGLIDVGVEGYLSRVNNGEPFYLDNVGHPVSRRLALGVATGSHAHLPGIDWDDDTKTNNGHFAPFNWNGSAKPAAYKFDRKAAT